jgi:hypothetical protein
VILFNVCYIGIRIKSLLEAKKVFIKKEMFMKKLLRLISVATMLLAATTFMACSSDDDDDSSGARSVSARTSGSIVGVVLDNKGEPVEGATVTLGGKTAKTNYGGEFEITGVSPNDTALIKAAVNYTSTTTALSNGTSSVDGVSKTETSTTTAATTKVGTNESAAYKLTAKKDGYLSAVVTGIYVTYNNTEDPKDSRKNALLHGLQYDYQGILDKYAEAVGNASGAVGTTGTTTTTATEDTTATTTVQTGSNADRVFKDVSEALKGLEEKYGADYYTEYFSDFATAVMVKCDASLKGKIKLNLKTKNGTTYDAKTYEPTSKPKVHVSAAGKTYLTNGTAADYTWETTADEHGVFEFKECLPTGVALSITVDSFEEKITKEGATEAEAYWFSSASQVIYAQGTGSSTTTTTTTTSGTTTVTTESDAGLTDITLGSKDANEKSYLIMLFAQNDKVWVTKTNVEDKTSGVLLTKNDTLTFTFNKAMKKVSATSTGITNLAKDAYTATLSEDKKTVTFTPNIGYWIISGDSQRITLTVEAEDGATTLLRNYFYAYFDNKVWVSVKDLSYDDYNDLRKLSDPIVLVFSKPMNEKIAVNLTNNKTAYTEAWNEADAEKGILANTELTLTPDAKVGYWDIGSKTTIDITVTKDFANSKESYIDTFGYWKVGAVDTDTQADGIADVLRVNFDNYNDVTIAKAETGAGFTVTFDKAIKAQTESELKANLKVYSVGASYAVEDTQADTADGLADVVLALSEDGKTITVTPQNTEFAKYGYYSLVFAKDKFVAKTGEKILRKPATTKTVQTYANSKTTTPFVTTFTLGTEFKYTAVTVVDKLPETALASRAIYVDNDKYLKITFNKEVRKSELKINKSTTTTASFDTVTNYIDGKDVYLPLATLADNVDVKVQGTVTSKDGQTWDLGSANAGFDTLYKVNKLSYKMVATSLYDVKKSIASSNNDVTVKKIAPDETFTFTFDQDVSSATWTAELYSAASVGVKDLEDTAKVYVATPVASGKVVTVTVSGKALDYGKIYYLSLKAIKRAGDDEVVVYDSHNATATGNDKNYGLLPGSTTATLNTGIIIKGSNDKFYIKVETKTKDEVSGLDKLYVLDSSNNAATVTTDFDEFAKSNSSSIVLEFSENIEAIVDADEVYLASKLNYVAEDTSTNPVTPASGWLKKTDVLKAETYAAKAKVEGNVLTITPTFVFKSEAVVYPIVFKKDGTRLVLKDVKNNAYLSKPYKALKWTTDKEISDVIEATDKSTVKSLNFAVFNKLEIGNGTPLHFQFSPILTETGTTANYGKYTLYKKVTKAAASATKWESAGTWDVGGTAIPGATTAPLNYNALASVDGTAADTTKDDKRFTSVSLNAPLEDFRIRKLLAAIVTTTDADAFNYASKASYKLVCEIDNVLIFSDVVTIEDATVLLTLKAPAAGSTNPTPAIATIAENAETEIASTPSTDVVYFITSPSYLLSVDVNATFNNAVTESANRVSKAGKVEAIIDTATDPSRKTIKVTIKSGTTAVKKDKITITAKDANQKAGTYSIEF